MEKLNFIFRCEFWRVFLEPSILTVPQTFHILFTGKAFFSFFPVWNSKPRTNSTALKEPYNLLFLFSLFLNHADDFLPNLHSIRRSLLEQETTSLHHSDLVDSNSYIQALLSDGLIVPHDYRQLDIFKSLSNICEIMNIYLVFWCTLCFTRVI